MVFELINVAPKTLTMDHLWKTKLQVWAYKRPATGYPATRAQENWTRNYTYLLSSHYTHKVLYSLPNWYSLQLWCQSIQPIPTAGILYIRTVPNPTVQKVPKPHFVTKCTFEKDFFSSCCQLAAWSSPQTAGDCTKKSNSPDTLCELLTRRLLFSQVTYIEVKVTHYKHYVYKMASFAIFMVIKISMKPCWGFLCQGNKSQCQFWKQCTRLNVDNNPQQPSTLQNQNNNNKQSHKCLTHCIWQIQLWCPRSKWNMGEILAFLA